ncbi:MAG: cysteine-rich VLP domain-containing protein [Oscillospiraceae bacterium]|jgi:hypothetical protein|nr:cysteine-rich VLP domain-containing protein [Oscillospiraceae bacterium]
MTPKQRQTAVKLIRKICCNYDYGSCLLLDDGDSCVCAQSISYSVNCKFFRHVLLENKEKGKKREKVKAFFQTAVDFESATSTDFITPANLSFTAYTITHIRTRCHARRAPPLF